jgi:transcriptional regulator with XRE-family HTH domain
MPHRPRNIDPSSKEAIGERLRLTREALGYSQTFIAGLCGMSVQAWNNNECGRDRISIDPALRLCRATGIGLDWIYQGLTATLPPTLLRDIHAQQQPTPRRRHRVS